MLLYQQLMNIKHMKDIEFIDLGNNSKEFSDYPKHGFELGEYVVKNKCFVYN